MNEPLRKYVQRIIDDALTRIFYDAKSNDFNKEAYSSVYVCTFKNKLVILKSKTDFVSNFETVLEIKCPSLLNVSRDEHLVKLFDIMPECLKERLEKQLKTVDDRYKIDYCWQFIHKFMPLACQDYFENFLQSSLNKLRHTKSYNRLVNIFTRKLYVNKSKCSEFELSLLIGDVIKSLGCDIDFDKIDDITNAIFTSNVLRGGIIENELSTPR